MLDHCSISVKDYDQSLEFYDQTLAVLGYKRDITIDMPEHNVKVAGYGANPRPFFWISPMGKEDEEVGRARGLHIAFVAPSAKAVQDWHALCLKLGGTDNGLPGSRPEYHTGYYGAFIIDPSGWRIEACFHKHTT